MKTYTKILCFTTLAIFLLVSSVLAEGVWTYYGTADGLADVNVQAIAIDADNVKWFATGKGVSRFDGSTWTTYNTEDGLADNWVHAVAVDHDNVKWFGTVCGVSSFDGTTWETYIMADGLVTDEVIAIAVDADNVKWFGQGGYMEFGKGVSSFDGTTWTTFTMEDGLIVNQVTSITVDADNVKWFGNGPRYLGVGKGVTSFDETNWHTYTQDGHLDVTAIAVDDYNVKWFAAGGVVMSFDGITWTNYSYKKAGQTPRAYPSIAVDADNVKWFGTRDGVTSFDGTTWTTFTTKDGLAYNRITAVAVDADNVKWFALEDYGVQSFDNRTTSVDDMIPLEFDLVQSHPNPFNPSTTINYRLNEAGIVKLSIYDLLGRKVATLVDRTMVVGEYSVTWNAQGFASGVYFCRLEQGNNKMLINKMVLLK